jgi:hypothetical protein
MEQVALAVAVMVEILVPTELLTLVVAVVLEKEKMSLERATVATVEAV